MKTKITNEMLAKYFSGNCSDQEKQEVEHWKTISEENSLLFEEMKALWRNALITNTYSPNLEAALKKVNSKLEFTNEEKVSKSNVTGFHILRFTLRAAAALLILFAGYWSFRQFSQPKTIKQFAFKTSAHEKRMLILPDSTYIWLNESSEISYPEQFSQKERKVKLEGEAYFEVAKVKGKPFIIEAGTSVTTVLGTHFNVRARKNENAIIVTVTEGKVQLANKIPAATPAVKLQAGDKGILISNTGAIEKEKNNDANFLAWQTGKLVFNNSPLEIVISTLSEYYSININNQVPADSNILFNSTFDNQSIEQIFKIMELTLNIKVEKNKESYVIKLPTKTR